MDHWLGQNYYVWHKKKKSLRNFCAARVQRSDRRQHICLKLWTKSEYLIIKSDEKAQINEQIHQEHLVKL